MAVPSGRGAMRETAILQATLELLAESGYDQLTIDAVAARARCPRDTNAEGPPARMRSCAGDPERQKR